MLMLGLVMLMDGVLLSLCSSVHLDLDRYLLPRSLVECSMHLRQRGGRNGRGVKGLENLLGVRAKLQ